MIWCNTCNAEIDETTASFCPHCGAPFGPTLETTLPETLEPTPGARVEPSPSPGSFCLSLVAEGMPRDRLRRLYLQGVEEVIGRSEKADFFIPIPSVSRRHAAVWLELGRPFIRDLGSRIGTMINGAPIRDQMPLCAGDMISLGDEVHFEVEYITVAEQPGAGGPLEVVEEDILTVVPDMASPESGASEVVAAIASFGHQSAELTTPAELLAAAIAHLSRIIRADRFLAILASGMEQLEVAAEWPRGIQNIQPPPSRGILRRVMYSLSESAFLTYDAGQQQGIGERSSVMMSDVKSVICIGLRDGKTCLGMLYADASSTDIQFGLEDDLFIQAVAHLTSARLITIQVKGELAKVQSASGRMLALDPVEMT